jgi:short-subunit dehydrogenase
MALPPPSEASTALVTGASSGIGAALAAELASRGQNLTLVARREERLRGIAEQLAADHSVRAEVIAADLGTGEGRDGLAARIEELGLTVEVLVNNAGYGDSANLARADREWVVGMVRLNCETLLDLQARYSPAMVDRGQGAILNVASTAAFQPLPGMAAYAATKAFVLSLTEATHAELKGKGVTATALCPGPVRTEFVDVAGVGGWDEKLPGPLWTDVEDVARDAVDGLEKGKRVVIPGILNRAGALTGLHSPRSLMLPLVKRGWRLTA